MIPKSGNRFSDKTMRKWSESPDRLINQWTSQAAGLPANCRATSPSGQPAAVRLRKTRGMQRGVTPAISRSWSPYRGRAKRPA